jgi:hypothetical protein
MVPLNGLASLLPRYPLSHDDGSGGNHEGRSRALDKKESPVLSDACLQAKNPFDRNNFFYQLRSIWDGHIIEHNGALNGYPSSHLNT